MIIEAILKINPKAKVVVRGKDINTCEIEWLNGTTPIPQADIEAKMVELQAEYDANQYQRDRATDYPPIGDQLDMIWHTIDKDAELQHKFYDFYQTVKKTKVKFPKQ
jgi:hypothetical protein